MLENSRMQIYKIYSYSSKNKPMLITLLPVLHGFVTYFQDRTPVNSMSTMLHRLFEGFVYQINF